VQPDPHRARARSQLKVECLNQNKHKTLSLLESRRNTVDSRENKSCQFAKKLNYASIDEYKASKNQESTSMDVDKEWEEKQQLLFKERLELELRSLNPIIDPEKRRKRFDII
jgi:hypothetical protein